MTSYDGITNNKYEYFKVLCGLIGLKDPIDKSGYYQLMKQLFHTDFYCSVPNDDNRCLDGLKLRETFNFPDIDSGCCLLEMFVALAKRCDEDMLYNPKYGDRSKDWFWMMLTNLGLNKFRDNSFEKAWAPNDIADICDSFMDRKYAPSGKGGIFPLKKAHEDQRKVEIWYQMCAYLMENPQLE